MATLHVRNVPEPLYAALRARAEANGRSIGAEAILMLEQELAFEHVRRRGFMGRRRRMGGGRFSTFTGPARSAVAAAQDEAGALGHDHVGTGHILLGLLQQEGSPAQVALRVLGLDLERARAELEQRLPRGDAEAAGRLRFGPQAKKALELALRESLALRHDYIGTEHLLLGIVREGASEGAEIVRTVEPDADAVRGCVLRSLAEQAPPSALDLPAHFRVVELAGDAAAWEGALNDAAAEGFDLVEIRESRAILRRG